MQRSCSLPLSGLVFATLVACATDEVAEPIAREEVIEIVSVQLQPQLDREGRPIPGTLDIETSRGRMDLTPLMPDRPRRFASWDDYHRWMVENLNAELVQAEDGRPHTQLSVASSLTLRYDAELDDMVHVDDPIEAVIGGVFGYVMIGDELVCVSRNAECTASQTVRGSGLRNHLPNGRRVSNGPFEIQGETWDEAFVFYWNQGARTSQVRGGIQPQYYRCGLFGLSWCYTLSGSNSLHASFTALRMFGSIYNGAGSVSRVNVFSVEYSNYAFGSTGGVVAMTDGMCATHSGHDGSNPILFRTATGYHGQGC